MAQNQTNVYMEQGGDRQVFDSGGSQRIVATQVLSSGSTAGITASGLTVLRSTAATKTFTFAETPIAGVVKQVVVTAAGSTIRVKASSGSTIGLSTAGNILKTTKVGTGFMAIGTTDGHWALLGNSMEGTTST